MLTLNNEFKTRLRSFLIINFGLILVALGIVLFKVPNHFVTGGVSGISIIMSSLFPGKPVVGPFMTGINMLLLIAGFSLVGKKFGSWTIYASFALSGFVWMLTLIIPLKKPMTNDPLLELIFSIMLPGIGSAIVFNQNASTGGTDIVAKVLSIKTHVNVGVALFWSDFVIAASSGFVFGVKVGLYSVLGLVLKAFLIDLVIENLNINKKMEIITSSPDEILSYILEDLKRGATIYPVEGAYTGNKYRMIHSVVNRRQAFLIREKLKKIDPHAFISIITTSEIIGKGFRNPES